MDRKGKLKAWVEIVIEIFSPTERGVYRNLDASNKSQSAALV